MTRIRGLVRITGNDIPDDIWRIIANHILQSGTSHDLYRLISVNRSLFNVVLDMKYGEVRWTKLDRTVVRLFGRLQYVGLVNWGQNLTRPLCASPGSLLLPVTLGNFLSERGLLNFSTNGMCCQAKPSICRLWGVLCAPCDPISKKSLVFNEGIHTRRKRRMEILRTRFHPMKSFVPWLMRSIAWPTSQNSTSSGGTSP